MPDITQTYGDSDIILVHIICQLVFAAVLWEKLSEMFATVISLQYALLPSQ